jgi:capsular exopolysaccharide synthesis family protein
VGIVTVSLHDRELPPEIANAYASEYVDYTKEFQSGGLNKITNWFDSYVAEKKQDLEQAQKKLQKFKRENNILSLSYEDRRNLTASNIETVNSNLMETRTQLASETSLLEQIKKLQKQERYGAIQRLADSAPTESGESVFDRKAKLEEELASLKSQYGEKHPKVQTVSTKLETVNSNIQSEIDQIRGSIENRVEMLRNEEKRLSQRLEELKNEVFKLNELGVDYNQLQNRKDNLKELYDTVLQRSSELNINSLYQPQDIEVLEQATTPKHPVAPSMPMNLAIGALLGLLSGAAGTFLLDALDTSVKSKEDIAQYTDKPVLAMLPKLDDDVLRGVQTIGESPADTIAHTAPKSSFAEGIKTLRTNLTFMAPDDPPELILMTSPGPRQGKTLTSVNTAIAMAQSGDKTLLLDTDIRKPRVHKALNLSNDRGITNYIKDDATVRELLQSTPIDNLSAITSGDIPPNPSEMLHSRQFEQFVEDIRQQFDRIIFDSPPLNVVSDALILSRSVDGVIVIAEFARTEKAALQRSLEQLREIGAPLLGTVLNQVPTSGGYYSYYRYSYYGESDHNRANPKSTELAG